MRNLKMAYTLLALVAILLILASRNYLSFSLASYSHKIPIEEGQYLGNNIDNEIYRVVSKTPYLQDYVLYCQDMSNTVKYSECLLFPRLVDGKMLHYDGAKIWFPVDEFEAKIRLLDAAE